MTVPIFFQIFLSSIFGMTLNQITYFVGLKYSTPTVSCALTNLLPAVTFLMDVPCRIESAAIKSRAGQAKVIGTMICVGGAMLLSFYHGSKVPIGESPIYWNYVIRNSQDPSNQNNHQKYLVFVISQIASSNFEGVVQKSSVLGNERSNNVGQWE
ncbi:WAT1-related protein At1g09380-like [Apium graveolens]|uniref:WAT1-related protein At1g09380-like n=1 Tax=Apium graveolens TaxID=4045 RepID=UPI003D797EFB